MNQGTAAEGLIALVADRDIEEVLVKAGLWRSARRKPDDPKHAMTGALRSAPRASRRRRSPRIFGEIAAEVSTVDCRDPAFRKLRGTLEQWFPRTVRED